MVKAYEDASIIARDVATLDDWLNLGAPHRAVVVGDVAGALTLTGIRPGDVLVDVVLFAGAGAAVTDVVDLTSEFTITGADTIDNATGTDTTGGKLLVHWYAR